MRLGEIKNILDLVIDSNNHIELKSEPVFGGQGQLVKNFGNVILALEILSNQSWDEQSSADIEELMMEHGSYGAATLTTEEYNKLAAYVASINKNLPLYYAVLTDNVEEQSETTINVKLPENKITSFKDLNELNDRLSSIFKEFNVDGQVDFKGFDVGSEWYIIEAAGPLTYAFIIACLDIAKSYFETRESYYKSEEAKVSYLASLDKESKQSAAEQKKHSDKYLDIRITLKIEELVEKIGTGESGRTAPEINAQLRKATSKLCAELENGTEFHLSLNPPDYADEENGSFKIDYDKIRALTSKEEVAKTIEVPEKKISDENSED